MKGVIVRDANFVWADCWLVQWNWSLYVSRITCQRGGSTLWEAKLDTSLQSLLFEMFMVCRVFCIRPLSVRDFFGTAQEWNNMRLREIKRLGWWRLGPACKVRLWSPRERNGENHFCVKMDVVISHFTWTSNFHHSWCIKPNQLKDINHHSIVSVNPDWKATATASLLLVQTKMPEALPIGYGGFLLHGNLDRDIFLQVNITPEMVNCRVKW